VHFLDWIFVYGPPKAHSLTPKGSHIPGKKLLHYRFWIEFRKSSGLFNSNTCHHIFMEATYVMWFFRGILCCT